MRRFAGSAAQSRHRYGLLGSPAGIRVRRPSRLLQPVERLEEQQPGELWDAVEIAVQPGVLTHDVARSLIAALEPVCGVAACSC